MQKNYSYEMEVPYSYSKLIYNPSLLLLRVDWGLHLLLRVTLEVKMVLLLFCLEEGGEEQGKIGWRRVWGLDKLVEVGEQVGKKCFDEVAVEG